MTYLETLDFLYSSLPAYQRVGKAAYKSDLDTTIAFDNHLNNPHTRFKSVHVAGTNGKGSVSNMLASVFQEAGYKTGLYTSPHLKDFRERIRIDGNKIDKRFVVRFVEKNKKIIENLNPSFFEMTVAMAFEYFYRMSVDIAVIETGMGGRLDSTNILNPLISIITNIGLDHTQFLGDTKLKIAQEKAGIIKENVPLIIGKTDIVTEALFRSYAEKKNSKIRFADKEFQISIRDKTDPDDLSVDIFHNGKLILKNTEVGLSGNYQVENIGTTLCALTQLDDSLNIDQECIRSGLKKVKENTGIEGRWQVVSRNPLAICDTAHNADGITQVIKQLESIQRGRLRFVLGFVDDKNIEEILGLFPLNASYYFTRASVPRSLNVDSLAESANRAGLIFNKYPTVEKAYLASLADSSSDDLIFVGGSTFIVADLLDLL